MQLPGVIVPMHGFGGARDLPIPAPLAISGGTAALMISFCVLILAWRAPRYRTPGGRPVPATLARVIDSRWFTGTLRAAGLLFAGYFVWALGVYVGSLHVPGLPRGGPDLRTNPVFGVFYVWLWVGLVPASLLLGRIYRAVNPVRTLFTGLSWVLRVDPSKGVFSYPEKLGYWPAAAGLFAFVWQELINPQGAWLTDSGLSPGVRSWLLAYVVIMFLGASLFGDTWFSRADPFEVYSDLLAKLSFWARREDGVLVFRSPLANLATTVPRTGLVAVVAVLVGSTAFDSYKETRTWVQLVGDIGGNVELTSTIALLVVCAAIGLLFSAATMSAQTDPDADPPTPGRRELPRLYAHSVVPIVVGYMVAHYLSYLVVTGQETLIQLSDPMFDGSNLLGTGDWSVNYWLNSHPTFLACTKVFAVVLGHVVGVVAAHDRALVVLPKRHQVTGQIGLLFVMLAFTAGALWLLFGASV
ncbi:MAG: hypothetical protein NTV23_10975 [Propionibacteriales bacterium]|nr:hypothetical protein [Propionibacteriales bacterium]